MPRTVLPIPAILDAGGAFPRLDLFALDTRDFGGPDPDQPDPFEWRDEDDSGEDR